jgi:5-methylcytosine-specific restriction protein A
MNMSFTQNEVYIRSEIHDKFGGQRQHGISTPANHNFVFLFSGEAGEYYGYADGWSKDGVFNYYGQGQEGDMSFTRGNKAIRDHQENDKSVLLFHTVSTGKVRFVGEMVLSGYHFTKSSDRNGNLRKAIVFELTPKKA